MNLNRKSIFLYQFRELFKFFVLVKVIKMSEVSEAAIKRTQDSLGKIIKKPVLTEKLLRKPPFKFLHDIIHAVSVSL